MNEQLELATQNTIRIETALSRFPLHRLAKRGNISIEISEKNETGEIKTKWEVTHNSKYGQPGPLAYKVDTLIVNRRIDDARPTIPKLIKLGSLTEITQELGLSHHDTGKIKKALLQNVGALITAKINYKGSDGTERNFEAAFTRYSAIFTGEKFPDGSKADAVYLILNDVYMKVLNDAQTRPLDYDYLRELPPAPRRLYELLGFQMFAALVNERPRAKMLYSYYCTRAPQTRYFDYDHVKKQMYKVHAPHLKSGYLAKIEFQEQRAESGEVDWMMLYTPGQRAKAEFGEASRKPRAIRRPKPMLPPLPPAAAIHEAAPEDEPLVSKLVSFHVAQATATELVRDYRKSVELQLRALPHRNLNKIKDLASWLIRAIKENYQLPEQIIESLAKEEEVRKAKAKKEAETARQQRREALQPAYFDFLKGRAGQIESEQPEAYSAFLANAAEQRREIETNRVFKPHLKERLLADFDHEEEHLKRLQIFFHEPTLDEWIQLNFSA
jgi:vacuolar-type H+-ATPase subunit H